MWSVKMLGVGWGQESKQHPEVAMTFEILAAAREHSCFLTNCVSQKRGDQAPDLAAAD